MIFRTLLKESKLTQEEQDYLFGKMKDIAQQVYEHECEIIDITFSEGEIKGLSKQQMKEFAKHRVNLCLENLGINKLFEEKCTFVKDWFYEGINAVQLNDFFSGLGAEYNINWKEDKFGSVWG